MGTVTNKTKYVLKLIVINLDVYIIIIKKNLGDNHPTVYFFGQHNGLIFMEQNQNQPMF